jgi:DNA-directed RNA polymerase specialized sigma24 family protein
MDNDEIDKLLARLAEGDREAIPPLILCFRGVIRSAVSSRVLPADFEDSVQGVFLGVDRYVRAGQFQNKGRAAFARLLKDIARSEARKLVRGHRESSLTVTRDGEEREMDPPGPQPTLLSHEILEELLNAALIEPARARDEKRRAEGLRTSRLTAPSEEAAVTEEDRALLQKLAFQYYYVDGLSVPEIARQLGPIATTLRVPVTGGNLNNWLSGGRILKTIVTYVMANRKRTFCQTLELVAQNGALADCDSDALRRHFCNGDDATAIAEVRKCSVTEIERVLTEGMNMIVASIKKELHKSRHPGT